MNIMHTTGSYKGRIELPPFSTLIIFQPEEMWMAEATIGGFLQMEITDESRAMLERIYEEVRRPREGEVN